MATSDFYQIEKDSDGSEPSHYTGPPNGSKIEHDLETVEALPQSDDYPHGTRLAIIVLSLMLSTFIVALDNVSAVPNHTTMKPLSPVQ